MSQMMMQPCSITTDAGLSTKTNKLAAKEKNSFCLSCIISSSSGWSNQTTLWFVVLNKTFWTPKWFTWSLINCVKSRWSVSQQCSALQRSRHLRRNYRTCTYYINSVCSAKGALVVPEFVLWNVQLVFGEQTFIHSFIHRTEAIFGTARFAIK